MKDKTEDKTEDQKEPEGMPPATAEDLLKTEIKRTCDDLNTCFPDMLKGNELERMLGQARIMDKLMLHTIQDAENDYDETKMTKYIVAMRAQSQYVRTVMSASILERRFRINEERAQQEQRRINRQEDKDWEAYIQHNKDEFRKKMGITDDY